MSGRYGDENEYASEIYDEMFPESRSGSQSSGSSSSHTEGASGARAVTSRRTDAVEYTPVEYTPVARPDEGYYDSAYQRIMGTARDLRDPEETRRAAMRQARVGAFGGLAKALGQWAGSSYDATGGSSNGYAQVSEFKPDPTYVTAMKTYAEALPKYNAAMAASNRALTSAAAKLEQERARADKEYAKTDANGGLKAGIANSGGRLQADKFNAAGNSVSETGREGWSRSDASSRTSQSRRGWSEKSPKTVLDNAASFSPVSVRLGALGEGQVTMSRGQFNDLMAKLPQHLRELADQKAARIMDSAAPGTGASTPADRGGAASLASQLGQAGAPRREKGYTYSNLNTDQMNELFSWLVTNYLGDMLKDNDSQNVLWNGMTFMYPDGSQTTLGYAMTRADQRERK